MQKTNRGGTTEVITTAATPEEHRGSLAAGR